MFQLETSQVQSGNDKRDVKNLVFSIIAVTTVILFICIYHDDHHTLPIHYHGHKHQTIPLAALSKASVCGRSIARIAGSNFAGAMDVCLL